MRHVIKRTFIVMGRPLCALKPLPTSEITNSDWLGAKFKMQCHLSTPPKRIKKKCSKLQFIFALECAVPDHVTLSELFSLMGSGSNATSLDELPNHLLRHLHGSGVHGIQRSSTKFAVPLTAHSYPQYYISHSGRRTLPGYSPTAARCSSSPACGGWKPLQYFVVYNAA